MFVCPLEKQLPKTIIGLIISVLPSVRPHETAIPFRTDFHEISVLGPSPLLTGVLCSVYSEWRYQMLWEYNLSSWRWAC